MQQEVLVGDLFEDLVGFVGCPQRVRHQRRVLQRRTVQLGQGVPVAKAQPLGGARDHVFANLEVFDQDAQHALGHVGFDVQQRQRAMAQLLEAAVDGFEQVVGLVLLDHHVGVADDPEEVRAFHLGAREQGLDVAPNHILEEHVRHPAIGGEVFGQGDEARQHARHLDARELGAAGVPHAHGQVHAQVRNVGKRMAGIERERREYREDVVAEVLRQPRVGRRGIVLRLQEMDAFRRQQRPNGLRPARDLRINLREGAAADRRQFHIRRHAVDRHLFNAGAELLQDGGHAHHEKLVEVGP